MRQPLVVFKKSIKKQSKKNTSSLVVSLTCSPKKKVTGKQVNSVNSKYSTCIIYNKFVYLIDDEKE